MPNKKTTRKRRVKKHAFFTDHFDFYFINHYYYTAANV